MEHNFPQSKSGQWSGMFKGKTFGDIHKSFNIDLEASPGRILLADRVQQMSNSVDGSSSGSPTDTGLKYPAQTGGRTIPGMTGHDNSFTNPTYAYSNDANFATVTEVLNTLAWQSYGNFGISIPAGSSIQGIKISISAKVSSGSTLPMMIFYGYDTTSAETETANITTTEALYTIGSPTDTLGLTWNASRLSNAHFFVAISTEGWNGSKTYSINFVTVKVYYTPITYALGFENVYRFLRNNASGTNQWWAICSNKLLNNTSTDNPEGNSWVVDPITDSPTDAKDAVFHEGSMAVTRATNISLLTSGVWNTSWWTSTLGQSALSSQNYHPIERLQRLLAVGDGNLIHTIDSTNTVNNSRLTFSSNYYVRNIYVTADIFWFGLGNKFGGRGKIAEWDGYSNNVNNEYEVDGTPIAGFVYKNSPFFVNEYGEVISLQGSYFGKYGIAFPIYEEQRKIFDARNYPASIFNHGCTVIGDEVLVNACSDYSVVQRIPSGVWRINMETKTITHGYGLSKNRIDASSTVQDFGEMTILSAGAIEATSFPNSVFLVGEGFKDTTYGISCVQNGIYNRGYIVTSTIPSNEIDDAWETIWLKYRKFINYGNEIKSIIVKYRTEDSEKIIDAKNIDPKSCTITWVSATSFTGPIPTGVAVGDEIEVVSGNNSGCCAHILTLSGVPNGSSTITVGVDETLPQTPSGSSLCRFDNWVKIGTITDTTKFFSKVSIPKAGTLGTAPFLQLKVELRGIRNELHEIKVISKTQNEAEL